MAKHEIFFVLVLSFLAGVFVASFFKLENYFLLLMLAVSAAIFTMGYENKKAWAVSGAIFFAMLGLWRTNISLDTAKNNLAGSKLGPAEFAGIVSKEPETDEKYQKIIIEDSSKNRIMINADAFPAYQYGDALKASCILEKPQNLKDSKFDYQMHLAKEGVYSICNKPKISMLSKNKGNKFYSLLLAVKHGFEKRLSQIFPDPEGAYLKGLLLGGSKRMTKDFSDAFARTGTTHTVAVSGYNVAIVAAFLMEAGIMLGLWRQQVFSFAVIGIIFFVLMTGAPSSAVRAGIMGSLVIWAMKEGRLANSANAILLAASGMLLANPLLLRYDAGFQLSFLATLGIVYLSPLLEKFFWRGRAPKLIQETVILTMAATVFVLPVVLNSFENLSLVSPFANFLILPAIPVIMGTGFAAGVIGFIFLPLGRLVGFFPYILLKIDLFLVQWMSNLSWSSVEIKSFGWKQVTLYYAALSLGLYAAKRKRRSRPAVEMDGEMQR